MFAIQRAAGSLPACGSYAGDGDCCVAAACGVSCSVAWPASCCPPVGWERTGRTAPASACAVQGRRVVGGWWARSCMCGRWQHAWCDCQLQESIDTCVECAGGGSLLCRRSVRQGGAWAADAQQTCGTASPLQARWQYMLEQHRAYALLMFGCCLVGVVFHTHQPKALLLRISFGCCCCACMAG
jgi:hypothetical protein